jgi:hypothetical protein
MMDYMVMVERAYFDTLDVLGLGRMVNRHKVNNIADLLAVVVDLEFPYNNKQIQLSIKAYIN